jgi:LmbE family N-acetylglucosaminyl deacetylase
VAGLPAGAVVHVPDGGDPLVALASATDLGVVAHPDDLELLLAAPVLACRDDPARRFCGVVVTDGAGSVRPAAMADLDDVAFVALRAAEQLAAADAAGMGAVVLLGMPSREVCSTGSGRAALVDALAALGAVCRPDVVHTHDPADAHRSHVAVATATVTALRRLPADRRPGRLLGWEGWRDLGWVAEDRIVRGDLTGLVDDAVDLARHHASQLGPKRYDAAVAGRWQANATFAAQREADDASALARGVDLTPLLDDGVDPTTFVADLARSFADVVTDGVSTWWSS